MMVDATEKNKPRNGGRNEERILQFLKVISEKMKWKKDLVAVRESVM